MFPRQSATKLSDTDRAHRNKQTENYLQAKVHENIQLIQTSTCSLFAIVNGNLREITTRSTNKENYSRDKKLKNYLAWQSQCTKSAQRITFLEARQHRNKSSHTTVKFLTQVAYCSKKRLPVGQLKFKDFSCVSIAV